MATFKYFYRGTELVHPRSLDNKAFWGKFGFPRRGVSYDGYSKWIGFVPGATFDRDAVPVDRIIEYKQNPSLHKCDARCQHAKGRMCECACGGRFHGFAGLLS